MIARAHDSHFHLAGRRGLSRLVTEIPLALALLANLSGCGGGTSGPSTPDPLQVILTPTHVSVCGGTDGAIDLNVSGGTPPFSFDWSNGAVTEDLTQLPAGLYSVTVSDAGGRHRSASTTLTQPEIVLSFTVEDVSIEGGSDGAVDLSVTGEGTPPYTFLWSNGSRSEDLQGVGRGLYRVTVTDARGGFKTDSSHIIDPTQLRDLDGNVYWTVTLGSQVWLASNFRGTTAPSGTSIPRGSNVTGGSWNPRYYSTERTGSSTQEEDPVFYNWPAAAVVSPPGWHVPSDDEWQALVDFLSVEGQGGAGILVGLKIKGTDSPSGFDALFTGYWDPGSFFNQGDQSRFWSSTTWESDDRDNWFYGLTAASGIQRSVWDKRAAFSVRLLRDDSASTDNRQNREGP